MASLNPRLSVYWLWLAVFFGGIALMPWRFSGLFVSADGWAILATFYSRHDLLKWQPVLIGHTLAALVLATIAATIHSAVRIRRGEPETRYYTLQNLIVAVAVLAVVFGWLRSHQAHAIVYASVLLLACGYPVTVVVTGLFTRGMSTAASAQPSTSPHQPRHQGN